MRCGYSRKISDIRLSTLFRFWYGDMWKQKKYYQYSGWIVNLPGDVWAYTHIIFVCVEFVISPHILMQNIFEEKKMYHRLPYPWIGKKLKFSSWRSAKGGNSKFFWLLLKSLVGVEEPVSVEDTPSSPLRSAPVQKINILEGF